MLEENFYRYIADPAILTEVSVDEVRSVAERFPYFHVANILLLKKMSIDKSSDFFAKLQELSLVVPDRKRLFVLIENLDDELSLSEDKSYKEEIDSFSLIDAFLQDSKVEDSGEKSLINTLIGTSAASSDYFNWSSSSDTDNKEDCGNTVEQENVKLKHQSLIDSFIEEGEHRIVPDKTVKIQEKADNADNPLSKPSESSYFTETLARIYVKQKRYEKALQIIKNLSLKYPEKNVYFADQIRFLEKLIINTKK